MFVHVYFLANRYVVAKSEIKHKQKTNEYFNPVRANDFNGSEILELDSNSNLSQTQFAISQLSWASAVWHLTHQK